MEEVKGYTWHLKMIRLSVVYGWADREARSLPGHWTSECPASLWSAINSGTVVTCRPRLLLRCYKKPVDRGECSDWSCRLLRGHYFLQPQRQCASSSPYHLMSTRPSVNALDSFACPSGAEVNGSAAIIEFADVYLAGKRPLTLRSLFRTQTRLHC